MTNIFLDSKSLKTLIISAIEVYNRETNGFIAGRIATKTIKGKERQILSLQTVYPLQTADRKPSQVQHGNDLAHRRTITSLAAMHMPLIGGFHSHTDYNHEMGVYPEPSEGDLDHIHDEMKKIKPFGYNLDPWLEIIMSIKRKNYSSAHKNGIQTEMNKKRLSCKITTNPYTAYKITLAGHWLHNGSAKLRIGEEAKIFSK